MASLVERSSLLDDKAMLVDGAVVNETGGQTSAENSLARALGSPNGRHQRLANAHDDSPSQKAQDLTMEALDITGGVTKIGNRWQR